MDVDSSVSFNTFSNDLHERDNILSKRTHYALKEKSHNIVQNLFKKSSMDILELSRVNQELEKVNIKISKLDFTPNHLLQTVSNDRAESSFNKLLDRLKEILKA